MILTQPKNCLEKRNFSEMWRHLALILALSAGATVAQSDKIDIGVKVSRTKLYSQLGCVNFSQRLVES